jgi:uncharacterized protein
MIGILVQLAISWLIIWIVEKENLSVLGLAPTKKRFIDFLFFFLLAGICCSLGFLLKITFLKQYWQLNPEITAGQLLEAIWWNIKSVAFEELIFRGVLLYIVIRWLGERNGILLSAIAFGMYHWFSFNVFGNIPSMIFIFIYTGIMGIVFAYGYAKSRSLYIPVAIHLGWGLTQQVIFSGGPIGNQVLVPVNTSTEISVSPSVFYAIQFFSIVFTPPFLFYIIRRFDKQERWKTQNA